jgi:cbb3-type cytochrome oxidase subunit 3
MQDMIRILVLVVFTVFGVGGVALVFGVEKKHITW